MAAAQTHERKFGRVSGWNDSFNRRYRLAVRQTRHPQRFGAVRGCDFYRSDCKPTHSGTYAARRRHLVRASNSTAIAATCLVTQQYVSKLVSALAPDTSYNDSKTKLVERGGKTYTQNTAAIGKAPRACCGRAASAGLHQSRDRRRQLNRQLGHRAPWRLRLALLA